MTSILIKKPQTHVEERQPCEDGGRNLSDTVTSQETPGIASNHRKWDEARKTSSLEPSKGSWF